MKRSRKSKRKDLRPSFQWYPRDWLTDPGLRDCSLAARGLWIDLLCWMWFSNERGSLPFNDAKQAPKVIAKMTGASVAVASRLLAELKQHGVYSVRDDGTIYNRRMVRDEALRQARATAGAKGGRARASKLQATAKQSPSRGLRECSSKRSRARARSSASASAVTPLPPFTKGASPPAPVGPELSALAFKVFGGENSEIADWVTMYGEATVRAALHATSNAGKRHPTYTHAILQRWGRDGEPKRLRTPAVASPELEEARADIARRFEADRKKAQE